MLAPREASGGEIRTSRHFGAISVTAVVAASVLGVHRRTVSQLSSRRGVGVLLSALLSKLLNVDEQQNAALAPPCPRIRRRPEPDYPPSTWKMKGVMAGSLAQVLVAGQERGEGGISQAQQQVRSCQIRDELIIESQLLWVRTV